jgi:hypothetical protein
VESAGAVELALSPTPTLKVPSVEDVVAAPGILDTAEAVAGLTVIVTVCVMLENLPLLMKQLTF